MRFVCFLRAHTHTLISLQSPHFIFRFWSFSPSEEPSLAIMQTPKFFYTIYVFHVYLWDSSNSCFALSQISFITLRLFLYISRIFRTQRVNLVLKSFSLLSYVCSLLSSFIFADGNKKWCARNRQIWKKKHKKPINPRSQMATNKIIYRCFHSVLGRD